MILNFIRYTKRTRIFKFSYLVSVYAHVVIICNIAIHLSEKKKKKIGDITETSPFQFTR